MKQLVAAGRVVRANWMLDFGNLPVVDQGDAYLSIYGNCSSADPVLASETVATVGAARWQPEIGFIL